MLWLSPFVGTSLLSALEERMNSAQLQLLGKMIRRDLNSFLNRDVQIPLPPSSFAFFSS
jgi:hypothetical protein